MFARRRKGFKNHYFNLTEVEVFSFEIARFSILDLIEKKNTARRSILTPKKMVEKSFRSSFSSEDEVFV